MSFGAESTAIKILYLMKDLYRDNQPPARYAYPGDGKYDSNHISDKSILVSKLSKIILDTINYNQYQNLSASEKSHIKMAIARCLYYELDKYASSYYDEYCHTQMTKGISFSIRFKDYPFDEAYQVNFPIELFSNQPLIKNCINDALREYPNILRKKENNLLNFNM